MASEFGILYTDQIYEQTLEKTSCDVIVTKENAVKRVEIDGVLGYEWGATNHRLGLCEIEHVKTISEFMYEQIKCEGAYPVFPHYVIDALKYNKVIERNDNQVRVDRDDEKLQKIKIQPYFGEAFFSPETYSSTFCKRQAIRGHVAKMRTFAKDRIDFEESSAQTKHVNGNKVKILEEWKGRTDAKMLMEGQQEKCVAHEVDPIYQLIKKMRYGMMYPTHYMLSQRYRIISERRKMGIEKWLLEKVERGVQRGVADAKGNESLVRLEKLMRKEELENSVIENVFPEFRSDVAEKFGIKLTIKDESEELFVQKDMNSEFLDEGEMGYKFVFGWKNTDFKVQSNYGEIVSEEVERLFKVILEGKEWSNEVEDPEDYFVDNLFNKTPDAVFERDGMDGSNRIIVKNKTTLREGQRHFSARFVSYWYTFEKVEVGRAMARIDIHDRETKFSEFDVDDYKPCSVAEMGLHSSTYIYQDLLIGSNRGEHVIDAKELVWYDIALTNYGTTRYFDQCWPSSCSTTELSMRYFLITEIFQRYRTDDRSSFADILERMRKNGYPRRNFLTYKHYYVAVIQEVFGDQRPIDVYSFCTDIFKKERRRGVLSMFPTFSTLIKSERLIDALFLNFFLWVVFEMENVDISFANKRHPLLISHDKGLRLIGVDLFNSALSISMGGWIPYVERICHADHAARKLNADELKIKRWFIDYYMDLSLDRRAEPRMSFKYEGLATWVGSNCGGVRDYIIQELPMRKPKPGLLILVYGEDGDPKWVEWAIKDFTQIEGSLGFIYIDPISVVNKSTFRTREMKIYNRGRLDRLILISSGNYTFGNKFLLSKLLSKAE
ncbi:truncated VP2 [African horse sickness virus 7]|uniref:Outer capsid protein VP2 n=1 Tax=African horse sickness virus 7 TaxID=86061 RepID=A0A0N9LTZ5_AHSV7|nr:truncated VP2 [African horse sickness virus 7]WES13910.1 VP2 [African horse sickness virus 7]